MKIGIVNAIPQTAEALRRLICGTSTHQVSWVAHTSRATIRQCAVDTPDLVLMDLGVSMTEGVEAIRGIMANTPCAILVVTTEVGERLAKVCEALSVGALDVVEISGSTPDGSLTNAATLLAKINTVNNLLHPPSPSARSGVAGAPRPVVPPRRHEQLVVIGASAGGPAALATLLRALPSQFSAPIVIVQHVDAKFAPGMAEWLAQYSSLPVRVARPADRLASGTVLLAGAEEHLVLITSSVLTYVSEPREAPYRPSIDVFFHSVVRHWRGAVVGVVLTGMGRDGAQGLKALHAAGAFTIAQDQATSVVYGMPNAAARIGAATEILPIQAIGPRIIEVLSRGLSPLKR